MIEKYYVYRFYLENAAAIISLLLILGLIIHCIVTFIIDKRRKDK